MKAIKLLFMTGLYLLTFSAIGQTENSTVKGNNAFSFEIFKKLFSNNSNVFISPYSISSALAMTYAGARGETEKQMSQVFHFDINQSITHQGFSKLNASYIKLNNESSIKLTIANALWIANDLKLKQDFQNLTKKYYNSEIYTLKGAKPINEWADKNTNGKIKNIVTEDMVNNARLVLTNAIYFKGEWQTQFNKSLTSTSKFKTNDEKEIDVQMMFQENEVKYFEDERNQVIELPYKGNTMTMTFILPKTNSTIEMLTNDLSTKLLSYYKSNLSEQMVNIFIPKFSITSEFQLQGVLSDMGMPDAFTSKADFSGMSPGLMIDKIIHKSFLEVNEKGSEAAAVTGVTMIVTSKVNQELVFRANRPFIVFITDTQTNSILFMGSILNPNK